MATSASTNTSLELDDSVPQWKKDLILRKRAQGVGKAGVTSKTVHQQQLLSTTTSTTISSSRATDCLTTTSTSSAVIGPRCTEGAPTQVGSSFIAGPGGQRPIPTTQQNSGPATHTVGLNASNGKFAIGNNSNINAKVNEQCNKKIDSPSELNSAVDSVIQEVKMVQDSVLVIRAPVATNGDCCKKITNGDGSDSDTSEELQYGPGIVSKLKSKYLSLTLREATIKSRPSILSMRRATSLENLLDAEDSADETQQNSAEHNLNGRRATVSSGVGPGAQNRRFTPHIAYERNGTSNTRTSQNRYRNTNRGNDSQKRARSVETLVRSQSQPNDISSGEFISGHDTTNRKSLLDTKKIPDANNKFTSCNGAGQRINRPKRIAPIMDETERPPADLVKQTLMIFEGPAVRRTKAPRTTGDVAAKVANFKNIIDQEKQNNNPGVITNNNPKKPLGTKPHITGPKPVIAPKRGSPVKRPLTPSNSADKEKDLSATRIDSPELILKSPPLSPSISPQNQPSPIPDISRDTTFPETDPNRLRSRNNTTLSETPDLIVHSSPARVFSPTTVKNMTESFIKEETLKSSENRQEEKNKVCEKIINKDDYKTSETKSVIKEDKIKSRSPSPRIIPHDSQEMVDGNEQKEITKQSMENISQAGMTVTYRFSDNVSKSHLPRLNTIPVRINRLVPDVPSPKISSPCVTPVKLNGTVSPAPEIPNKISSPAIIPRPPTSSISQIAPSIPLPTSPEPTPLVNTSSPVVNSSPNIVSATNKNITNVNKARPPTPVQNQNKNLSPREIEKNSINKLKTLEQPVSKVVVSMRSVDEVLANKNLVGSAKKSARHNEQTTILFNFQQRDTIPDYIATDGSTNTRRGKREKPKPGESGIILLPGAPSEEFADDDEDWMLSLNGPPSPCDVHFENDNILIDGRSSISKQPKRQKMRIQFDDDATQVFEYLSEASMIDEVSSITITSSTSQTSYNAGHSVASLTGSSLASYTPSKMSITSDFQLGVTRATQPIISPPSSTTNSNNVSSPNHEIEPETMPITYSAETNADILF